MDKPLLHDILKSPRYFGHLQKLDYVTKNKINLATFVFLSRNTKKTNKQTNAHTQKKQKQNQKQPIKWDQCFNNACFVADSGSAAATDHLVTLILRLVLTYTKLNSQA